MREAFNVLKPRLKLVQKLDCAFGLVFCAQALGISEVSSNGLRM
jgi:hypothetical protein